MGIVEGKGNTERLTYKTNGKYMNTVVEQAPPYAIDCDIDTAITKLAEYENLEEQKKLLTLPCAVGDKVFIIVGKDISKQTVKKIIIREDSVIIEANKRIFNKICFGKTVFLTREEAEAALKELER